MAKQPIQSWRVFNYRDPVSGRRVLRARQPGTAESHYSKMLKACIRQASRAGWSAPAGTPAQRAQATRTHFAQMASTCHSQLVGHKQGNRRRTNPFPDTREYPPTGPLPPWEQY